MDMIHWSKIAYDLILLFIMLLVLLFVKYFTVPFKSGFYCNDYSVNMPYKSSTFPNWLLMTLALPTPFLFMSLTEIIRTIYVKNKNKKLYFHNNYKIILPNSKIIELKEQIGNLLINYGAFLFGLLATFIITNLGKNTVGRLRPNFLDICKPVESPFATLCQNPAVTYIVPGENLKCGSQNISEINESRKSFPSGHASTSFYTCIFLILFINKFWKKRNLGFLPQFFQFLLFTLAWFVALSRVIDNKHHPTDVIAGSLLGCVISSFTFYYLDLFYRRYNFRFKYDLKDNKLQCLHHHELEEKKNDDSKYVSC